jgi:uracil phosphoribosyltransferase
MFYQILCEEALSYVNPLPIVIKTPTGASTAGISVDPSSIVAVSIIRAGDSMLDTFMKIAPEASVGKILIQRNEETKEPILFYSKLPNVINKNIVLLDPMLATGGSAKCAIRVLLEQGALESNIMFVNVLACPEGIAALSSAFPGNI